MLGVPRLSGLNDWLFTQGSERVGGFTVKVLERRANGEAARFKSVLAEYSKAQDITVKRIYLETMENVLKGTNNVIIDGQNGGAQGVVPYLPLPTLDARARSQPAAPVAVGQGGGQ